MSESPVRAINRLYAPLALSWLFMAMESPISVAILSRMPDATLHTAAFFVIMAVSLFIESPVIDLLATSTTFARDRQGLRQLKRFALLVSFGASGVHALVVLTPLYGLLLGSILGLRPELVEACRVPLILMIPWSAAIGWRRFLQGAMIRVGATRPIGFGTALRMITIAAASYGLYRTSGWPGSTVIGAALVLSVCVEATYISLIARRALVDLPENDPDHPQPSLAQLSRFHFPLTGGTMLLLMTGPIINAAIARMPEPLTTAAAWQVQSSLLWLTRTVTYALPEVVIRFSDQISARVLRGYCWAVGGLASLVLVVALVTGFDLWVMREVLRVSPELALLARVGLVIGVILPLAGAAGNYLRGMLTAQRATMARLYAVVAGAGTLSVALVIGVWQQWPGILVASWALVASVLAEWAVVAWAWVRTRELSQAKTAK